MTLTLESSTENLRRSANWESLVSQFEHLSLDALDGYVLLRQTPFFRDLQFCLLATSYNRPLTLLSESFPEQVMFRAGGQTELTQIISRFWQKVESSHET